MSEGYDIIGDLHGHADALIALLTKLDYGEFEGVWRHADRQAIFVGDFVDLGPQQVETVMLVKRMVEAGSALAVLGNHDLNSIAWYLPDRSNAGEFLRPHFSTAWGEKNRHQHSAFLAEVESHPDLHREIVEWFLTLPLWLDLPGLRVVHACWHTSFIEYLKPLLLPGGRLSRELMVAATLEPATDEELDSPEPSIFKAVEALTKGIEVPLPLGTSFKDKYGIERRRVRVRWWKDDATTYQTAALLDESLRNALTDAALPQSARVFGGSSLPVFIGHYWLTGTPALLTESIACVDYSVGQKGQLCAYRWSGETVLNADYYTWNSTPAAA